MVKYSLLHNGMDFFADAVEQMTTTNPSDRQLKSALDHLANAVELVLKQRLYVEHWSLVFQNIDDANKTKVDPNHPNYSDPTTGRFESVNYASTLKRLTNICQITIRKTDDESIAALRNIRNQIVHFGFANNQNQAVSLAARTWAFIFDFVHKHISLDESEDLRVIFDATKDSMVRVKEFIEARNEAIKGLLQGLEHSKNPVIQCPVCRQHTLEFFGKSKKATQCVFCLETYSWYQCALEWVEQHPRFRAMSTKDLHEDPPLSVCPECGNESLFVDSDGELTSDGGYICLECGEKMSLDALHPCPYCGQLYNHEDGWACRDCVEYREGRDD